MPFAIDCVCSDVENLKACAVTALSLVVTELVLPYGECKFLGGVAPIDITATGEYSLTPVSSWVPLWDDLNVWMKAERSLPSDADDDFRVGFYLKVTFTCDDFGLDGPTSFETRLFNEEITDTECISEPEHVLRALASSGAGVIVGAIVSSSPLASCQGFEISTGQFEDVTNLQVVDVSAAGAGTVCLCPSGGVPPYRYMFTEGILPSGVLFDASTGCFTGLPDGDSPGTKNVTISARDGSRPPLEATVTCQYRYCLPDGDVANEFY